MQRDQAQKIKRVVSNTRSEKRKRRARRATQASQVSQVPPVSEVSQIEPNTTSLAGKPSIEATPPFISNMQTLSGPIDEANKDYINYENVDYHFALSDEPSWSASIFNSDFSAANIPSEVLAHLPAGSEDIDAFDNVSESELSPSDTSSLYAYP